MSKLTKAKRDLFELLFKKSRSGLTDTEKRILKELWRDEELKKLFGF